MLRDVTDGVRIAVVRRCHTMPCDRLCDGARWCATVRDLARRHARFSAILRDGVRRYATLPDIATLRLQPRARTGDIVIIVCDCVAC